MRRLPLLATGLLLFLALPAAGAGYGNGQYCPDYDIHQDLGVAKLDMTSHERRPVGAFVLTVDRFYLVEDTAVVNSVNEPYLYSFAFYEESGVLPGLQRYGWVCMNVESYELADFSWFY